MKKIRMKQFVNIMISFGWVAGLMVAGSDSPYMPWINILGLVIFCVASVFITKRFISSGRQSGTVIYHGFRKKPVNPKAHAMNRRKNRNHADYALSA